MPAKDEFGIEVLEFEEVHGLPGFWSPDRYRALLARLDFEEIEGVAEADLLEMAAMAAQDEGLPEASDHVLEVVFGDAMSAGLRQNLVDDLTGERPWEQYADLRCQAGLFSAVEFLQQAFPNAFGIPDAARVRVRVSAAGGDAARWLREGPDPALLVRLLADALDERAALRRLYRDPLKSPPFPEAASILWRVDLAADARDAEPPSCELDVYSSLQWLGGLRNTAGLYTAWARPDRSEGLET